MNHRRNDNVCLRSIAGETLLIPICGHLADLQNIFALEGAGPLLWNMLDGNTSVEKLRDAMVAEYDVDAARAEQDVRGFLDELASRKLASPLGSP